MNKSDSVAMEINDILVKQNDLLNAILTEQRLIRETVTNRDWERLDVSIQRIQGLSEQFTQFETYRSQLICNFTGNEALDVYQIAHMFSLDLRQAVLENFRLMRQKLAVSKIENDALSDYIRVTKDFLQGVFNNAVPQARNTVYSKKGRLVNAMPESVVLDRMM